MASLSLDHVCKSYGRRAVVVDVTLDVAEGEFIVILGPSGCGKTSTLRMVAGFVEPSSGRIRIGREDVTRIPTRLRNIGMVFQDYALFPHMTVRDNIGFGLRQRGECGAAIRKQVDALLERIRLPGHAKAYIDELSGGQQQRVALARALAIEPGLLLMDEPLGALDRKLREAMQWELKRVQEEFGVTTVLVTHDQHEAMALADRIVIMNEGRIQQVGSPRHLYEAPANAFVADFLGKTNLLNGQALQVTDGHVLVQLAAGSQVPARMSSPVAVGADVLVSVRPEHVLLATVAGMEGVPIEGIVQSVVFLGNHMSLTLRLRDGTVLSVEHPVGVTPEPAPGERFTVAWPHDAAVCFPVTPSAMAGGDP